MATATMAKAQHLSGNFGGQTRQVLAFDQSQFNERMAEKYRIQKQDADTRRMEAETRRMEAESRARALGIRN